MKLGANTWCPICVNKTEEKLNNYIRDNIEYIHYQTRVG